MSAQQLDLMVVPANDDGPAPLKIGDEWCIREELAALPVGSLVADGDGDEWEKLDPSSGREWRGLSMPGFMSSLSLHWYGPGRVLRVGGVA